MTMIHKINTQRFRHDELWKFIKRSRNSPNGHSRILDVGCGRGWFLERFYNEGFRNLYGCDINDVSDFSGFEFKIADLNKNSLPYPEEQFDLVICSDVLEHLENPFGCIREIRRVLKKGGTFILTIPNCANILQRVHFLLTGNSRRFKPKPDEKAPHISMTPSWILNHFIKDTFEVVRTDGDGFVFKSRAFTFLPRTPFFSYTVFWELRKIN